uniref:Uncharacterized protein n=1 Tax=Rhizophora mucronata TaxID=61149 RepID=A0A2P2NHP4_RHIMU
MAISHSVKALFISFFREALLPAAGLRSFLLRPPLLTATDQREKRTMMQKA